MDFSQIQEIIRMVSKHKISEFTLKEGEFKLTIRTQTPHDSVQTPAVVSTQQPLVTSVSPALPPMPTTVAPPPAAEASAASGEKASAAAAPEAENLSKLIPVKSPMVGTFFRSPSPDKPAFVKIGDVIDLGQTVCIIEAMKLFNEIESDVKGKVVKVLVDDGRPVEYDQVLFLIEPA